MVSQSVGSDGGCSVGGLVEASIEVSSAGGEEASSWGESSSGEAVSGDV